MQGLDASAHDRPSAIVDPGSTLFAMQTVFRFREKIQHIESDLRGRRRWLSCRRFCPNEFRSDAFTFLEFEKTFAMSGSRTTTFVPSE
jgi:hypothetical protein